MGSFTRLILFALLIAFVSGWEEHSWPRGLEQLTQDPLPFWWRSQAFYLYVAMYGSTALWIFGMPLYLYCYAVFLMTELNLLISNLLNFNNYKDQFTIYTTAYWYDYVFLAWNKQLIIAIFIDLIGAPLVFIPGFGLLVAPFLFVMHWWNEPEIMEFQSYSPYG